MFAAQQFELALAGLLGVRNELEARDRLGYPDNDVNDELEKIWDEILGLTAGRVTHHLQLIGELADAVKQGITARNRLAHFYLIDRQRQLRSPARRTEMVAGLAQDAARFVNLQARVDAERFALMHANGVTDDHMRTPFEALQTRGDMAHYDPFGDEFVPPEPFE